MGQFQAKQIKKIIAAFIKITNLSVGTGLSSVVVTSQITSALSVAGEGATAVPLVSSSGSSVAGVAVTSPANRVEMWDNTNKEKIVDASNNEVYGKITVASSIYTLSFYSLDDTGTENTFSFPGTEAIDFDFVYRFQFHELPADAAVSVTTKNVSQDPKGSSAVEVNERLTVTGTNVVTNLSNIPSDATRTKLFVNGKIEDPLGGSPAFTLTGTAITWSASNAGYSLETTDIVDAMYYI